MTTTHINRLRCVVTNTPGTSGNVVVGAAPGGRRTFSAAEDGKTFDPIFIEGNAWEVRSGCLYTHSTATLTRGTFVDSSTGSAINLTSAAVVSLGVTAKQMTDLEPARRLTAAQVSRLIGATYAPGAYLHRIAGGVMRPVPGAYGGSQVIGIASPVPYTGVRIHYHVIGNGSVTVTGFKFCVAATDTLGSLDYTDVTAAAFKKGATPYRGATAFDTAATGSTPGWKAGTFAGASSVSLADPGAGVITTLSSDIIAETGVIDSNGRYPLLVRYYFGTGGYSAVTREAGRLTGTQWATDFPTDPFVVCGGGGDCVGTLASWTSATAPFAVTEYANMTIEFFTAGGPTVTVHTIGDSRIGISSEYLATNAYRSFENYLQPAMATLGVNSSIVRGGITGGKALSDNTSGNLNYVTCANAIHPLSVPGDWIVYLIYSVNDGALTNALATSVINLAASFALTAKKYGQRVCFIPAFPRDGGYSGGELTALAMLRAYAGNAGNACFDPITQYGTGIGDWSQYRFNGDHMTDAGYRDMAARVAALLV